MVVLHILLIVLAVIFGIFAFLALIWGDDSGLTIFIVTAIMCGLCIMGAAVITEENTIIETEVVKTEVKELITSDVYTGYKNQTNYHMILEGDGKNFDIKVDLDEYLKHSVGEIINVEVTTEIDQLYGTIKQEVKLK